MEVSEFDLLALRQTAVEMVLQELIAALRSSPTPVGQAVHMSMLRLGEQTYAHSLFSGLADEPRDVLLNAIEILLSGSPSASG